MPSEGPFDPYSCNKKWGYEKVNGSPISITLSGRAPIMKPKLRFEVLAHTLRESIQKLVNWMLEVANHSLGFGLLLDVCHVRSLGYIFCKYKYLILLNM